MCCKSYKRTNHYPADFAHRQYLTFVPKIPFLSRARAQVIISGAGSAASGVWSQAGGSLVLSTVGTLPISTVFTFSFTVRNPALPQAAAAPVSISGTLRVGGEDLDIPPVALGGGDYPIFGIDHASRPFLVRVPEFAFARIEQTNPVAGQDTVITARFSASTVVPIGSRVIITGLTGSQVTAIYAHAQVSNCFTSIHS
jgi:hypothetical protein